MKRRRATCVKTKWTFGLAISLTLALSSARADWRFDAETGALYDSNLSNSDRSADVKDDWAWQTEASAANGFQLTRDLRLDLAADLHALVWAHYSGLDNLALGGKASFRYRFGLGRLAPWAALEDHLAYSFFREDTRSGYGNRVSLRGGIGITDRLALEAGYTFDNFDAGEKIWSSRGNSGALHLIFDLTSSLQVAVGYSYRYGDVVSYALPPRADADALAGASDSVPTFGQPAYTAYRYKGRTNAVSASLDYILGRNVSLQFNYEFRDTTYRSLEYGNHLVEAKIAFVY